ncbi:MAG: MmcQ/YjbR family DNA-binding protein [Evtepia sp.]
MNNYPWLDAWLLDNPGAGKDYKAEWDWHRYLIDGKMFAATCQPGPEHKGWDCRELVNLKCDPMLSELLRSQYPDIRPGFYSNKRHWISVFLDGAVPEEVLKDLCTRSYQLVFSSLTKKRQREILAQE